MRYIYYIVLIIFLSSAVVIYSYFGGASGKSSTALVINDQSVSVDEYNRLFKFRSPYLADENDFVDALITKKLLIQQAMQLGIDQDELFRWSIQNFYEQSLIKLLIDKKISETAVEVTDLEIDRYIMLSNKKLHLEAVSYASLDDVQAGKERAREEKTLLFRELSMAMKNTLVQLQEGSASEPVQEEDGYWVYHLQNTEPVAGELPTSLSRDDISETLSQHKREKQLNDWIKDLRQNAKIKVLVKQGS